MQRGISIPGAEQEDVASIMKTGLILEGGAMRGMFTCGVIDVFMKHGIIFDGAAGISAGAIFGCNYKSKQPGRGIRYNKKYCADPRYCSIKSLITTGDLYGADFCYRELPNILDPFDTKTFKENPMEFYVGATDIQTGKVIYHKCTDGGETDIQWMRASASMPLVSRPVKIGRYKLLDGGIVDSVPYRYMESKGYNRNVIILTQPRDYVKKKSSILPLLKTMLPQYPEVVKAMEIRHLRYNRQMREIEERERDGRSLVIRPANSLGISRTEKRPEELERVYLTGRLEGLAQLSKVRAFLKA